MIRKLRWKLVGYATTSIFLFLLIILGTINLVNFSLVAEEADQITQTIADNGGTFAPIPQTPGQEGMGPGGAPTPLDPGGPGSPEAAASSRYFTVAFDKSGNGTLVEKRILDQTVSDENAIAWAKTLLSKNKGWTETYFRFRSYRFEGKDYVTVLYFDRELHPSYRILYASIIGGVGGTLVSFAALIPLSALFVKPLVASRKKQQRFISDASHELKTPLTIISANKEILELEQGESEATKAIGKQVGRLNAMVKNLNALANMDEGVKPVMGSFDLARTCMEMVDGFQGAFEKKGIALEAEIPLQLPFNGDQTMIRQLVSILLDNALKYSKTEARFSLLPSGDRTTILVRNDADVPDGPLDRVFERFYRADEARAGASEGSGIGLSLAMEIVKSCNGRISAKGENGFFLIKAEL